MVENKTGARFERPPLVERSRFATIRAHDRTRAREVATLVDEFLPRVRRLLTDPEGDLLVWCMDQDLETGGRGLYADSDSVNAVFIGPIPSEELEHVVAHELAHWCFARYEVELPIAIEEGVCDEVARIVVGGAETADSIASELRIVSSRVSLAQALRFSREDWFQIPEVVQIEARLLADEIVREFGLERIDELRERARLEGLVEVPPEWFEIPRPEPVPGARSSD